MSSSVLPQFVNVTKRMRAPIDNLAMKPMDPSQVVARMSTKHIAILTWLLPCANLRKNVHNRYEVYPVAERQIPDSEETEKLGLVTILLGSNIPKNPGLLERWIDPGPHSAISTRIAVEDRVHWQYSTWNHQTVCKSRFWGKVPQQIYGVNLDYSTPVNIDTVFNTEKNIYDKYQVSVPHSEGRYHIKLDLEDTGISMLDSNTPVVPGFIDNESALKQIGMSREVLMKGVGGCVYRQTLWNSPSLPNVARVKSIENINEYFIDQFDAPPIGDGTPIAAWLLDEVSETQVYQMEAQIETENEPSTATHFGDRSLHERVQKKAMNRYYNFGDNVRGKTYSDLQGREYQR